MKNTSDGLMGTGAVAEMLGIPRFRFIAWLDSGKLPEPELKLPGRRLFTAEDVERIREALEAKAAAKAGTGKS